MNEGMNDELWKEKGYEDAMRHLGQALERMILERDEAAMFSAMAVVCHLMSKGYRILQEEIERPVS